MQKLAVIDCGTNTFHLLVVSANTTIHVEYKKQFAVKLGEGGINKNTIQPASFRRGVDALKFFSDKLKELGIEQVAAFATSAIRSADNCEAFLETVLKETGLVLNVISGDREAELIFNGVKHAYPLTGENILTMDIGGGSVEFIIGNNDGIQWFKSFDVGAARLVEMFHKTDPIFPADVAALNAYLDVHLNSLHEAVTKYPITKLVGSAGSYDSVCELINERFNRNLLENGETWCPIDINEFRQVHEMLLNSTLEERKQMPGLVDYRVEMMVVASCLIEYAIRTFGIAEMYCSTYSLKEGVMFEMLGK